MNTQVRRIFVQKKSGAEIEAKAVLQDLRENLLLTQLTNVIIVNRYDVSGITDEEYEKAKTTIFSEPQVDMVFDETYEIKEGQFVFAVEYLPGQYDQRADSCAQCIQILTEKDKPLVKVAKLYILEGDLAPEDLSTIKNYIINPVEAHEASLEKPSNLSMQVEAPKEVETVDGFINMNEAALSSLLKTMGFAMDLDDLHFCQDYFKNTEKRNPTITEMRMIDTYWSDHCRHTTFTTKLNHVSIEDELVKEAFEDYLKTREHVYGNRDKTMCFMDIATIGTKFLKKQGMLSDLDESEEINACSIVREVIIDGKPQKYLIMFKNETHNHPTEIEPFGGAATCLGGAIRDPLSGRSYVYQAMRITGSGNPNTSVKDTIHGKLPQRKISVGAAQGYSSYGNQIGLATGLVQEIYDEGYIAKRMEVGAVVGAAPYENVVRERPCPGDIVILLGGKTGRDGCGGATGSSKAHTEESLGTCGAEVQKGNPPEERKLQRLFRKKEVSVMIKRCNDFGAGGVSVAIGELAEGLLIHLDFVPKKYEGLDGTELAISESQERMAVVVSKENVSEFIKQAHLENLEATPVAEVTDNKRLQMLWNGKMICDISREFLDTNGAQKQTDIVVPLQKDFSFSCVDKPSSMKKAFLSCMENLNVCSQKGLVERFDSTIGAGTLLMPYGGKYMLTPAEAMAAKVPALNGVCETGTIMGHGYNPVLSRQNPYLGAIYAVVEAVTKVVVSGGSYANTYLTLQEYFEKPGTQPERWGKPFMALLGALKAQKELGIAAIGGKDSMSGTFEHLDVPPTLVAFAITTASTSNITSPEFKKTNTKVVLLSSKRTKNNMIDFGTLKDNYDTVETLIASGKVYAASSIKFGGICEAISKMCFGNKIGFAFSDDFSEDLFTASYGDILLEIDADTDVEGAVLVGRTCNAESITVQGETIAIDELITAWQRPLEKVFPTQTIEPDKAVRNLFSDKKQIIFAKEQFAKPRVFIPVFPGTNCEYDTARAFEQAGAVADVFVFNNLTSENIRQSLQEMEKRIRKAQIVMIPGGFSGGDEPDGSGKFIATAFRNPSVKDATMALLKERDGLMLGICNGFQALIKLGLVPYGEIRDMDDTCPTLTYNSLGRHISTIVTTKICSKLSPWFASCEAGELHKIPISHGEGRFVASDELIAQLHANGQIATQYVDFDGIPSSNIAFNANQSDCAIEGITSPDGRILGKMGHSERIGSHLYRNITGNTNQKLFRSGVQYFK